MVRDEPNMIGWIGTGKMGLPMCHNLLGAGFRLTAFNPTAAKLQPLVEKGAAPAGTCKAVAQAASIVVSMISDDAALRSVALGAEGVLANARDGAIFVDMSTVSPRVSAEVADEAARHGIDYLRAPVSGGVALAETAKLTVMASGPAPAHERCRAMFDAMSAKQMHVGVAEEARYLKLLINMMVGVTSAMMGEALAFGRRGGLDWTTMLDAIGSSAVASPLIGYKLEPLKARDFTPTFSVRQMMKDFDLLLASGNDASAPLPVSGLVRQLLASAAAHGDGDLDFFAAVRAMERMAGLPEDGVV